MKYGHEYLLFSPALVFSLSCLFCVESDWTQDSISAIFAQNLKSKQSVKLKWETFNSQDFWAVHFSEVNGVKRFTGDRLSPKKNETNQELAKI